MPDLLDEIKEDISKEKYSLIWQKYGNYIIGAAIAILIITGAAVAGKNYMNSRNAAYNDALYEASIAKQVDAIKKYDDIIASANSTYQAIAALRKAAILLNDAKTEDALTVYKKIIEKSGTPKEFKDLAKLLYSAVSNNIAAENKAYKDENTATYLAQNMTDNSIFKYSALEISAFQEIRNNNYTKAKDIFAKLEESTDAPVNIKKRAKEMLDVINSRK